MNAKDDEWIAYLRKMPKEHLTGDQELVLRLADRLDTVNDHADKALEVLRTPAPAPKAVLSDEQQREYIDYIRSKPEGARFCAEQVIVRLWNRLTALPLEQIERMVFLAQSYRLDFDNSLRRNEHTNDLKHGEILSLSQRQVDAILTDFINYVAAVQGCDLALKTKDVQS